MFALLLVTLPTQPNAVRLRIWRALKALGCSALRDGAYLLPMDHAAQLEALAQEVTEHGGTASVLALSPRDEQQRLEILAQFDRSDSYAAWHESLRVALLELATLPEVEARKRVRSAADALEAIRRVDYYPGPAMQQAQAVLALWRQELDARFSKDEPTATQGAVVALDAAQFKGKRWGTRARPWVDRLACAWLVRRFIDPNAQFVWLADVAKVPKSLIGFDYDGARFTHVGKRVSFEVLMASFNLEQDPRLQPIAQAVHYLDAGGMPAALATGLEAILSGLRELHADDDALLAAACTVFDALYAVPAPSALPAAQPATPNEAKD